MASPVLRRVVLDLESYRPASAARLSTVMMDLVTTAVAERAGHAESLQIESRERTLLLRIHAFIEQNWARRICLPASSRRRITSPCVICTGYSKHRTQPSRRGSGGALNGAAGIWPTQLLLRCRSARWRAGGACRTRRTSAGCSGAPTGYRPPSTVADFSLPWPEALPRPGRTSSQASVVAQGDLVGLGNVTGLDGPQPFTQSFAGLPQELERVGSGALRSGAIRISPVLLDEVCLRVPDSDFVGCLQRVVRWSPVVSSTMRSVLPEHCFAMRASGMHCGKCRGSRQEPCRSLGATVPGFIRLVLMPGSACSRSCWPYLCLSPIPRRCRQGRGRSPGAVHRFEVRA